jgi:putative hydrolase of the HAD superfamily
MKNKTKRAVFFDFGDTLTSTNPSYPERCVLSLRHEGYEITDEDFEIAYLKTDYEIYKKYKAVGYVSPNEYKDWFFPFLCRFLNIKDEPFEVRYKVSQQINKINFHRLPLPGSIDILSYLKDKGYFLGVISNNDGFTEDKCKDTGIYDFFDIIADSTALNMIKPDQRIFNYVINELNVVPEDCVHIGDLYGSDVKGGSNAGIDVVWLNKKGHKKLDNTRILNINDISELFQIL